MGKFRVYWNATGHVDIEAKSKEDAKDIIEELWQRERLEVVLRELTSGFDGDSTEIEICDEELIESVKGHKGSKSPRFVGIENVTEKL